MTFRRTLTLSKLNTYLHWVVGWWYTHSSPLLQTGQNLQRSRTFWRFTGTDSCSIMSPSSSSISSSNGEKTTLNSNDRDNLQNVNDITMCQSDWESVSQWITVSTKDSRVLESLVSINTSTLQQAGKRIIVSVMTKTAPINLCLLYIFESTALLQTLLLLDAYRLSS